jgi:tRNA 2-thiouridine synthesizing protein A
VNVEPDEVLDCRGQRCPLPVIALAKHLTQRPVGTLIRVYATDPAAPGDIAAWCRLRDQDFLGTQPITGGAMIDVRRLH